jgi:hypothetical protein
MAATVRIDPAAHASLARIAKAKRLTLSEALSRAIEAYRREMMIQAMDADYAHLRANPAAWAEELAERSLWDATNTDGLENE